MQVFKIEKNIPVNMTGGGGSLSELSLLIRNTISILKVKESFLIPIALKKTSTCSVFITYTLKEMKRKKQIGNDYKFIRTLERNKEGVVIGNRVHRVN